MKPCHPLRTVSVSFSLVWSIVHSYNTDENAFGGDCFVPVTLKVSNSAPEGILLL